jgi:hypothetical protein
VGGGREVKRKEETGTGGMFEGLVNVSEVEADGDTDTERELNM